MPVAETSTAAPTIDEVLAQLKKVATERDEYKQAYVVLLEKLRKLEAGLVGPQRERYVGNGEQLLLKDLLSLFAPGAALPAAPATTEVPAHQRASPTGRKPLPDNLPVVEVEVMPLEVQRAGLDAFTRIGEDITEVVEHRRASMVLVKTVRPKFLAKDEAAKPRVAQHAAPELPVPRALAGPGLLADSIVKRWDDHLPLHRMERGYGREGLSLARSTICGWHFEVAALCQPLVEAMWADAFTSPYLCADATGVLVQALEKCRRAHFFVVVAPEKHVLFGYTPKHNSEAVTKLLGGYKGNLVADAHSVYECLYATGDVVECGCWAHSRRYFFKSLDTDGKRADQGLGLIQALFKLEREYATSPPEEKLRRRQRDAKPLVEAFFGWCDAEALKVLDETPISKAIGYARNQREALARFLSDGRLPIHNNWSENALRRQALGRRNWLFVGSDEGGEVNATLVTLLASCKLHGLEPLAYLTDLLCLLPAWPVQRVLELAPASWATTSARPEVKQQLAANVFRRVALGELEPVRKP